MKDGLKFEKSNELSVLRQPDKIIRSESFDELKERYGDSLEMVELAQIAQRLYKELETDYGILVPASFLVGKNEDGEESIFSVVDKIEGKNLQEVEISDKVINQTGDLYASITRYFLDKLRSGELYLTDINNSSQYVFGRRSGEQEDRIHLVDTDIYLSNNRAGLYLVVGWLARHLCGTEIYFQTRFDKAREHLKQFVEEPLAGELTDSDKREIEEHISEINKFLKGEKFGHVPESAIPPFQ